MFVLSCYVEVSVLLCNRGGWSCLAVLKTNVAADVGLWVGWMLGDGCACETLSFVPSSFKYSLQANGTGLES